MSISPPILALALLKITSDRIDRDPLIGDMEEEFRRLHANSPASANSWYWRQIIFSAPALICKRLRQPHIRQAFILIVVTIAAYAAIVGWDSFIARRAVRIIGGAFSNLPLLVIRGIYILTQMIGISIAGGAVSALTFQAGESFAYNARRRLALLAAILFVPPIAMTLFTNDGYTLSYRLIWLGAAAPSLIAGAFAVHSLRRNRHH